MLKVKSYTGSYRVHRSKFRTTNLMPFLRAITRIAKITIAFSVFTGAMYGLLLLGLRGAEIENNMRAERTIQYLESVEAANPDGIVVPSNEQNFK